MNRQQGKKQFVRLGLLLCLLAPVLALAHPGGLDKKGGHRCWTNCEQFDLMRKEYHFHEKPVPMPEHEYSFIESGEEQLPQQGMEHEKDDLEINILLLLSDPGSQTAEEHIRKNPVQEVAEEKIQDLQPLVFFEDEQVQKQEAQVDKDAANADRFFLSRSNCMLLLLLFILLAILLFLVLKLKRTEQHP